MQPGFRLELPNDDVFVATAGIESTHDQDTQWVFNGGRNTLALFEQFVEDGGSQSDANGLRQSAFLGTGAGVHRITIRFTQYEGSDDQWGDAAAGDSMTTKRDTLDQALNTTPITSENPATLETGEFSTDGKYNPLTVVVASSSLTVDYNERTSAMDGQIEFLEAADFANVFSATGLTG